MITVANLKSFLGVTVADKDTLLQECIDDAHGEANRTSGRELEYSEHTIYIDGSGSDIIQLSEAPIVEVTELKYWNGEDYVDLLDAGDTIADNIVYLGGFSVKLKGGYIFYKGVLNIMVTFTAGYRYADLWQASKAYLLGNYVIYNGSLYVCSTAHTSGVAFDASKWTAKTVEVVPNDLEKAVKYNASIIFYESPAGKNLLAKTSENMGGQASKGSGYDFEKMREYYMKTYEAYRKINI